MKDERELADADAITGFERCRGRNADAAHERAVLAREIFDRDAKTIDGDSCVPPGHFRRIEPDGDVGIPAGNVLAIRQRKPSILATEPAGRSIGRGLPGRRVRHDGGVERIPVAVHRPHDSWAPRIVADAFANLVDYFGEAAVGDEDTLPDALEELGLGERAGPVLDEQLEQLESFGRQVYFPVTAKDAMRVEIQPAVTEADHGM